jgi:hypothetical protein
MVGSGKGLIRQGFVEMGKLSCFGWPFGEFDVQWKSTAEEGAI